MEAFERRFEAKITFIMDVSRLHLIMTLLKRRMSREIRWNFLPRLRNFPLCRFAWNGDRVFNSFDKPSIDRFVGTVFQRISWLITVLEETALCKKRKKGRKRIEENFSKLKKNSKFSKRDYRRKLDVSREEKKGKKRIDTRLIIKSRNLRNVKTRILRFPFHKYSY